MSQAIAHFAFGAAMTTLVVTFLLPTVPYPRSVILAGGGWAMVPDFHHVSPVYTAQLHRFHQTSPATDLFWFHRTLDTVDAADANAVGAAMVAFFVVATAIAEWRSYRAPAVVERAYETYLGVEGAESE